MTSSTDPYEWPHEIPPLIGLMAIARGALADIHSLSRDDKACRVVPMLLYDLKLTDCPIGRPQGSQICVIQASAVRCERKGTKGV